MSIRDIQWWDDYYRWHGLPRPNYYIGDYEYGDPERDVLELRLISVLKSYFQQRQISE